MMVVTVEAADKNFLSADELVAAVGATTGTPAFNARITADICIACNVAIDGAKTPTLRRETVVETVDDVSGLRKIALSRRHAVVITSVTIDGETLAGSGYSVNTESGVLSRLGGALWSGTVVVTYVAGFATVPADLFGIALDMARLRVSESSRDPLVKRQSIDIPGVQRVDTEYWVNMGGISTNSSTVPPEITARLARYMNVAV